MPTFEDNMIKMHGAKAELWLASLPDKVQELAKLWNLRDLKPVTNLSFNYVISGFQGTQPIILKIGYGDSIQNEVAALAAFKGYGMVQVFAVEATLGAMLIERAVPGKSLKEIFAVDDLRGVEILCKLIDQLHKAPIPTNSNFPLLSEQLKIIDQDWVLIQQDLVLARKLKKQLLANPGAPVLLHGDLHYDNILSNGDGWVVIDPKGVIGDPIYDKIGSLIREPLSELMSKDHVGQILKQRVNVIADYFKLETQIILNWTFVHTVMAICWCIEDNNDPAMMQKFLRELKAVMKDFPPPNNVCR